MRKLILIIGIIAALFATSCKKDTSVKDDNGQTSPAQECFYFEAFEAGILISMNYSIGYESLDVNLEYSLDKSTWQPFRHSETHVTLANVGDRVYIRATGTNDRFYNPDSYENIYLCSTGRVKVGGNIMYLLDKSGTKTDFDSAKNEYAFASLFSGMNTLIDASDLCLPATTGEYCYQEMFYGCSALTKAPKLPATDLAEACYYCMFYGCTSLQYIEVDFTYWNSNGATTHWLDKVSETGTFKCPAALDVSTRDIDHILEGWTVVRK